MNPSVLAKMRDKAGDGNTDFFVEVHQSELGAMCSTVEAAQRHFDSIRGTRAEAICAQGPLVDLGNQLIEIAKPRCCAEDDPRCNHPECSCLEMP